MPILSHINCMFRNFSHNYKLVLGEIDTDIHCCTECNSIFYHLKKEMKKYESGEAALFSLYLNSPDRFQSAIDIFVICPQPTFSVMYLFLSSLLIFSQMSTLFPAPSHLLSCARHLVSPASPLPPLCESSLSSIT